MKPASFAPIRLLGDTQRAYAHRVIDQAPAGYVVKVAAETRRDAQNRKLWPMLKDLQQQVPDCARFSTEDAKFRFLNALGTEMRFLPTLANEGMFPVGMKSSTLTVGQFSGLVELIYEYGGQNDVRWSEPRLADAA